MPPVSEERVTELAQRVADLTTAMDSNWKRRETERRPGEVAWDDPRLVALHKQTVTAVMQATWRQQTELAAICRRFLSKLAELDAEEAKQKPPGGL